MSHSKAYFAKLSEVIGHLNMDEFDIGLAFIRNAWLSGRQIITLGNGGSAMTALHFITDWSKMIYLATGKQFRGRSLIDNIGVLTAYSNDICYADAFKEQLKAIAAPGDLVLAISGSGNSENVIRAIDHAKEMGCETFGLCGFSGGKLKDSAKASLWVRSNDMQLCEDVHAIFGHIVMQSLCSEKPT